MSGEQIFTARLTLMLPSPIIGASRRRSNRNEIELIVGENANWDNFGPRNDDDFWLGRATCLEVE